MANIMLDLETMGNNPNAAICSIGAIEFDIEKQELGKEFYVAISLEDSLRYKGIVDASTILWWMGQEERARNDIITGKEYLQNALIDFEMYLCSLGNLSEHKIWGNGSDFDNVILASAYRNNGYTIPWRFWNNRCYRTVKNLYPDIPIERIGTYHNALDDAKSQALHLMKILKDKI